jgi:hypothetical protein
MTATAMVFASGVAPTTVAITAGAWFAKISPNASASLGVAGTIYVEILANATWVQLSYIDGQGRAHPYALTDLNPSVFVPGVHAVGELRLNAKGAQAASFTNAVYQYN